MWEKHTALSAAFILVYARTIDMLRAVTTYATRNKGDVISVLTKNQRGGKKVNRSGKMEEPICGS
jgi:hypothetical protein